MKTPLTIITILAIIATTYGQGMPPLALNPVPITGATKLDSNYTIEVAGGLEESKPIDIKLSGYGPEFTALLADPLINIKIIVSKKEEIYNISYNIISNVLKPQGNSSSYVTTAVQGGYYANLGKPFTVMQVGDKMLTMQIDKTKEHK